MEGGGGGGKGRRGVRCVAALVRLKLGLRGHLIERLRQLRVEVTRRPPAPTKLRERRGKRFTGLIPRDIRGLWGWAGAMRRFWVQHGRLGGRAVSWGRGGGSWKGVEDSVMWFVVVRGDRGESGGGCGGDRGRGGTDGHAWSLFALFASFLVSRSCPFTPSLFPASELLLGESRRSVALRGCLGGVVLACWCPFIPLVLVKGDGKVEVCDDRGRKFDVEGKVYERKGCEACTELL